MVEVGENVMLGSWMVDVVGKKRRKIRKGRGRSFMDFGASSLSANQPNQPRPFT